MATRRTLGIIQIDGMKNLITKFEEFTSDHPSRDHETGHEFRGPTREIIIHYKPPVAGLGGVVGIKLDASDPRE